MRKNPVNSPPKAALVTLGCPMNQVDSESIMSGLVTLGFEIVTEEEADVIVVNTCGFIEPARVESIDTILSVAELKETGSLKALVVAGCLAERYRDELERDLTEADAIVGLADRDTIPGLCLRLLELSPDDSAPYSRVVTGPPATAYLRIAEGCDNRCSYCAIPFIRGPYKSVPADTIVAEAKELADLGARELILIAQDTTSYGIDREGETLAGLLGRLSQVAGVEWIRLLYAHPARVTNELIEAMATLPKVLPYLDIPVQHASRKILRRMSRPMNPEKLYALIDRLRDRIEGLVLRTSLMVGFPGETDEDFQELLAFVERVRFERMGAFVYSREEGTRAAEYDEEVPDEVAEERHRLIMETQAGISGEFHRSLVGQTFDMIVDSADPESGTVTGRTYMDAPDIDGNFTAAGSVREGSVFCRVLVTGAGPYDLEGRVIGPDGKHD